VVVVVVVVVVKEVVEKVKDGRTYYLTETPFEGRTKSEAEEFSQWLKEEKGYADTFVEEIEGFYYVYGDPGVTIQEVQKLIDRFTLIENYMRLIEQIQWATFHEIPQETTFAVKCHRCGYEWSTRSQMNLVTCPSCGFKTPRRHPNYPQKGSSARTGLPLE